MDAARFLTTSLRSLPQGESVARVLAAALRAVEPGAAVRRHLKVENGGSSGPILHAGGRAFPLRDFRRVLLIGAGKAGLPMAGAVVEMLGERLSAGLVIVKEGHGGELPAGAPVEILEAGHPLPDERGVAAAQRLLDLLSETTPEDLVLCLISGGGSALLVSPAGRLTLADLQRLTSELLACGASIDEINALRKHLERLKGGNLARLAAPARLVTLILSDVVGDPLEVIASGPTVPDPSTYLQAWRILERYELPERLPEAVIEHLQAGLRGEWPETPKPGDPLFETVVNVVVASNAQASRAALEQARQEGFDSLLLTSFLQGEARQAGRFLAAIARQIAANGEPLRRPACLLLGGETTVTLQGNGRGGRNQELALGALPDLAGLPGVALVALATDGGDGPTDAAGAVVTGESLQRARQAGLEPYDHLARNDAYPFFEALGDLIKTGPTQTNVNDLAFLFAF